MGFENDFRKSNQATQFGLIPNQLHKPTLAYSFTATKDGTLVSAEITKVNTKQNQDEVVNVFPEEDLLIYGNVEILIELLIAKDAEAWRALPEKLRTFLMRTVEWQYRVNEKTNILNLIVNDMEIRWNGSEWVVQAFHPDIQTLSNFYSFYYTKMKS